MASLKNMFHGIYHRNCHRTNDKLMSKLKCIPLSHSVPFFEHPYVKFVNEKLETVCKLIGRQCQVVGQHRARRTGQILALYRNLYGENHGPTRDLLKKLGEILRQTNASGKRLFLLSAVLFDWNKERITDDMFIRSKNDMKSFIESHAKSAEKRLEDSNGEVWEKVVDTDTFKLWRCPVQGSSLYKYKVFGTYKDLPASEFYEVQLDIDYRKRWDKYVIKLEKVEYDELSGSEVIYWATHFPLNFLSCRDYLYVRRCEVDRDRKVMTMSAKGIQHPSFPVSDDYVRVDPYISNMLIKPHTTFEEKGFDYVMYYYDDPKLYVPSWAVNKMTVSSLPTFVNTIHEAAMKLYKSKTQIVPKEDKGGNSKGGNTNNNNSATSNIHLNTMYSCMETENNPS